VRLTLYRRDGCHLCDLAEEALRGAGVVAYDTVVLGWEGELEDRYGTRIPVLKRADTDAELDWPFDHWTVRRFVAP
jgi:hypothetical protein